MKQVSQESCGTCVLGDVQNMTVKCSEKLDLPLNLALIGVGIGLDDFQLSYPTI